MGCFALGLLVLVLIWIPEILILQNQLVLRLVPSLGSVTLYSVHVESAVNCISNLMLGSVML